MAKNDATLRNLDNQVGQLATELKNHPQKPNIIEAKKEHAEAQDLEEVQPSVKVSIPLEPKLARPEKVTSEPANSDQPTTPLAAELLQKTNQPVPTPVYKPPPPYPQRLQKKKQEIQFKKFLDDPGCFTIPCNIGAAYCGKALCDLGASINLMPMSIFKKLGIDFEANKEVPIILGRPFLATGRTLIDVQKGELTMRVQDDQVTFNVFKSMRFPDAIDDCSAVSDLEDFIVEKKLNSVEDPLERILTSDPPIELTTEQ
ncbi:uncharacterized protein [Gossypium hirsutum]|uniref:Reverse transcriptase domain-containing protein n=1 Tax=Gossypium hirsutum TaxID=3635 RepID=A0ABM3BWA1_GOSHI|nr:uncharacterized protein LOC107894511 [Gossypium hirsutum]